MIRIESIPTLDRMDQVQPGNEKVYPVVWARYRGIKRSLWPGKRERKKKKRE